MSKKFYYKGTLVVGWFKGSYEKFTYTTEREWFKKFILIWFNRNYSGFI